MLYEKLMRYIPANEQEENDKRLMLQFLRENDDAFLRTNETAHFTASSWIVNGGRDKVLMVYHNIYNSWSWTGGHADGEEDLLTVAMREAQEETGVKIGKTRVGRDFLHRNHHRGRPRKAGKIRVLPSASERDLSSDGGRAGRAFHKAR